MKDPERLLDSSRHPDSLSHRLLEAGERLEPSKESVGELWQRLVPLLPPGGGVPPMGTGGEAAGLGAAGTGSASAAGVGAGARLTAAGASWFKAVALPAALGSVLGLTALTALHQIRTKTNDTPAATGRSSIPRSFRPSAAPNPLLPSVAGRNAAERAFAAPETSSRAAPNPTQSLVPRGSGRGTDPAGLRRVATGAPALSSSTISGGGATALRRFEPLTEGTLGEEASRLMQVRSALVKQDPNHALALLGEWQKRFPQGVLSDERELLRLEALARVGQGAEAQRRAQAFLAAHPESPLRGQIARFGKIAADP